MRFLYAVAGVVIFVFFMNAMVGSEIINSKISDDAIWMSIALVFAGGMAGGNR